MNHDYIAMDTPVFCRGCGHNLVAVNTDRALKKLGLRPTDVILVTDIGCHGIIDKLSHTHTIHGLHGRSPALAAGTAMGLDDPEKKVIVFIGDGGATIGLQHLVDAAVRNVNMTVVIHNNMLYGMTGGQTSGLTPQGFKTETSPLGKQFPNYDLSSILFNAGGSHVRRIVGTGDFSEELYQAFKVKGFSAVEVMETCPGYGVKFNTGKKTADFIESAGMAIGLFPERIRPPYARIKRDVSRSLLQEEPDIPVEFANQLKSPLRIIISGSAGEGVQLASALFAKAAVASGLHAVRKGSYPVTVGAGFSAAEIIIAPNQVLYTGIAEPDVLIIVSNEGMNHVRERLVRMKTGLLLMDSSLESMEAGPNLQVIRHGFREIASPRSAAFMALGILLKRVPCFPVAAFEKAIADSKIGRKFNFDVFHE